MKQFEIRKILVKKDINDIKAIIAHKEEGQSVLIWGLMVTLILCILIIFVIRMNILRESLYYIDDSLSTAVLSGMVANADEYGKSNQIVLHNTDKMIEKDWTIDEATILASELNYNSYYTITPEQYISSYKKNCIDYSAREIEADDYYVIQSILNVTDNLASNLANNKLIQYYNRDEITDLYSIARTGSDLNNAMSIPRDSILNNSFIGTYIVSDVQITDFEIYNIYKATFAQQHVYASEFMTYSGTNRNGQSFNNWNYMDVINNSLLQKVTSVTWNGGTDFESAFNDYYKRTKNVDSIPVAGEAEYVNYIVEKEIYENKWITDKDAYERGVLFCYTDTGVTYQEKYVDSNTEYIYFYEDQSGFNPNSIVGKTPFDAGVVKVEASEEAPIAGVSCYKYIVSKDDGGPKLYSEDLAYKQLSTNSNTGITEVRIEQGSYSGKVLKDTSILMEITFTISTFPDNGENLSGLKYATQEVSMKRLVSISKD